MGALNVLYLVLLLVVIGCMVLCDHRWKLAFFLDAATAAKITSGMVALFLVWDGLGVAFGVFSRGDSPYMTGVELAPDIPLEEPFFLFFLTYLTLNLTSAARRLLAGSEQSTEPTRSGKAAGR